MRNILHSHEQKKVISLIFVNLKYGLFLGTELLYNLYNSSQLFIHKTNCDLWLKVSF